MSPPAHPGDRAAFQTVFARANSRLAELSDEHCREVELAQTKSLRAQLRGEPMLKELLLAMRATPPGPEWKARVHHSMRRLHAFMLRNGAPVEQYQVAVNAFVDGQTELAARWFTPEVLLRPWGEH